ncbi:MAG: hypothetical protein U0X73_12750 [Thermoanaerobaculia bacterium]
MRRTRVSAMLAVGVLLATGAVEAKQRVENQTPRAGSNNTTWEVSCPDAMRVVNGFCQADAGNPPLQNAGASGAGTWTCTWAQSVPKARVWAMCEEDLLRVDVKTPRANSNSTTWDVICPATTHVVAGFCQIDHGSGALQNAGAADERTWTCTWTDKVDAHAWAYCAR